MADTNSRITIRLEDGTPPDPNHPPVPPAQGVIAPPNLNVGPSASGDTAGGPSPDVAPVPPTTGVIPGPPPDVAVPRMPARDADEESPDEGDEDSSSASSSVRTASSVAGMVTSAFPPLRAALVVATVAIETLVETIQALDSSIQEMAERGGEYDAGIAQANAVADLRLTLAEMRRANALSEELSSYMDERSQLGVEIKDAVTELSRGLIPAATEVVKLIRPLVRVSGKTIKFFNDLDGKMTELNTKVAGIFSLFTPAGPVVASYWAIYKILVAIDEHVKDPPKDDFSNFRNELRDFLNPVTSRVDGPGELRAAMAHPHRDKVFPAFRP